MRDVVYLSGPALLLSVLVASACTTWQPQVDDPGSVIAAQHPDRVRLTVASGRQEIIEDPSIRTDSIVGSIAGGGASAVALADVSQIEVRERDSAMTGLAVALVGVLVWVAAEACFGLVSPCGGP